MQSPCRLIYHNGINTHIFFFFFNNTPTTEIYTLSLHDALPIWHLHLGGATLLRERLRELARSLVVHDTDCGEPRALREREEVASLDSVRVDAHGMQLAREERGRGGTEVFLRDAQELKGERVHLYSSPPLPASSA